MRQAYEDVFTFHKVMGEYIGFGPALPPKYIKDLRLALIKEEYRELKKAIKENDLVKIADGIADLIYVTLGTSIAYGIYTPPIWNEVHKTNMNKLGGGRRADGKLQKPPGWQGPRIEEILKKLKENVQTYGKG